MTKQVPSENDVTHEIGRPLRIACFAENAKRGSGPPHSAVLTVNAAVALGHEADLVLHRATGDFLDQLLPKVNVIALDGAPSLRGIGPVITLGGAGLLWTTLKRTLVLRDSSKWVYWSLLAMRDYLQRARPDMLISFGMKPGSMTGMLACLRPSPATIHVAAMSIQPSVWMGQRSGQKAALVRHYRGCDAIFGCSEGVSRDTERVLGLPRLSVATFFEPVLDNLEAPTAPPSHPWLADRLRGQTEMPVIVSAGKLNARKDYATLIRAFAKLREERAARLVIFGKGELRRELIDLARSLGVGDDVDLPGEYPDLVREFAGADLFALASRGEGLGKVIVEALAAGLPVACTDCPSGPREILEGGRYGTLVPVGDADALAAAMTEELRRRRSVQEQISRAKAFSSSAFASTLIRHVRSLPSAVSCRPSDPQG